MKIRTSIALIAFVSLCCQALGSSAAIPIKEPQKQERTVPRQIYKFSQATAKNASLYLNAISPAESDQPEKIDSGLTGVLSFVMGLIGIAPAALILGIIGLQRHRKQKGFAIAGLVLGIIELLYYVTALIVFFYIL